MQHHCTHHSHPKSEHNPHFASLESRCCPCLPTPTLSPLKMLWSKRRHISNATLMEDSTFSSVRGSPSTPMIVTNQTRPTKPPPTKKRENQSAASTAIPANCPRQPHLTTKPSATHSPTTFVQSRKDHALGHLPLARVQPGILHLPKWSSVKCSIQPYVFFTSQFDLEPYLNAINTQLHPELIFSQGDVGPFPNHLCWCKEQLALRTSQPEKNPGRLFSTCKQKECDFFRWLNTGQNSF